VYKNLCTFDVDRPTPFGRDGKVQIHILQPKKGPVLHPIGRSIIIPIIVTGNNDPWQIIARMVRSPSPQPSSWCIAAIVSSYGKYIPTGQITVYLGNSLQQ